MPTQYILAFEISQKGLYWWFPAVGLAFALLSIALLWLSRRLRWSKFKQLFACFTLAFSILWTGMAVRLVGPPYFHNQEGIEAGSTL
jgi:cobalamin synthase